MDFSKIFNRSPATAPSSTAVPPKQEENKIKAIGKKVNEAVSAVGAKVNNATAAVKASIAKVDVSSKTAKAWNWTKNNYPRIAYTVALVAASTLFAIGAATAGGFSLALLSSPLAIAGGVLGSNALFGAGIYEYKKYTEASTTINRHAIELYNAVKEFDNLNPSSNKYVTAQRRFNEAKENIKNDLIKFNPDGKKFINEVANIAKDYPNFRINTIDGRYDVVLEKVKKGEKPKGVTFEDFVKSIVNSQSEQIKAAYDKELKSYAETFAKALKNDVKPKEIKHEVNKAITSIQGKKEYRILGKGLTDVSNDLLAKIKNQLGERYVKGKLNELNNLIANRYGFWSAVEGFRKNVRIDFNKKFDDLNKQIKDLEKELKNLDDVEKGLEREKVSLRAIVRDSNNTQERIKAAEDKIAELDVKRVEFNAKKDAIKQQIEQVKKEQADIESKLGSDYLIRLNAKRRELARILGQEVKDLEIPEHPTFGDKVKYWAPRAAVGAGVVAGAYYGYPYAKPYVEPVIVKAKDYAGPVIVKAKDYAGPYVNKASEAVANGFNSAISYFRA